MFERGFRTVLLPAFAFVALCLLNTTLVAVSEITDTVSEQERTVSTALELDTAISEGVPHIVVSEHIDARTIQQAGCGHSLCSRASSTALQPRTTLRSIRGNCTSAAPIPGPPELVDALAVRGKQCVIYTDKVLLNFYSGSSDGNSAPFEVWLENIFIRLRRIPQDATQTETQVLSLSHISAWMTNITMQNDAGIAVALKLSLDAYVFMEDSSITGFKSVDGKAGSAARLSNNSSLALYNVGLSNNTASGSGGIIYLGNTASISEPSRLAISHNLLSRGGNYTQPAISKHSDGFVYADPELTVYNEFSGTYETSLNLGDLPSSLFLSAENDAFARLREETGVEDQESGTEPPSGTLPQSQAPPSTGQDNGVSTDILIALIAAILAVLVVIAGLVWLLVVRRRRNRTEQAPKRSDTSWERSQSSETEDHTVSGNELVSTNLLPSQMASSALPQVHTSNVAVAADDSRFPPAPTHSVTSSSDTSQVCIDSSLATPVGTHVAGGLTGAQRTPPASGRSGAASTLGTHAQHAHAHPNAPPPPKVADSHAPNATESSLREGSEKSAQAKTLAGTADTAVQSDGQCSIGASLGGFQTGATAGVAAGTAAGSGTGPTPMDPRSPSVDAIHPGAFNVTPPPPPAIAPGSKDARHEFHREHSHITTVDPPAPAAPTPKTTVALQDADDLKQKQEAAELEAEILNAVEDLEDALDALHKTGQKFLGRYIILSGVERRGGGQGLVQFAQVAGSGDLVAIKFFNRIETFRRELDLYETPMFKDLMPKTLLVADNSDGAERLGSYAFPPCIVITKGQSLNEFAVSTVSDFITVFQTLMHVARAMNYMHEMGYVHRDIKPGNILRRPGEHDWTLIDFGCSVRIGTMAKISYSLGYTAPEVIHAVEAGERHMRATAALDIWSLGVVAFELLTRRRVFAPGTTREQVYDMIGGRSALPWEPGSGGDVEARLAPLRGLKRSILLCLSRDPSHRPSAASLIASWDHALNNLHSRTADAPIPAAYDSLPSASAAVQQRAEAAAAAAAAAASLQGGSRAAAAAGAPAAAAPPAAAVPAGGNRSLAPGMSSIGSMLQAMPSTSQLPGSSQRSTSHLSAVSSGVHPVLQWTTPSAAASGCSSSAGPSGSAASGGAATVSGSGGGYGSMPPTTSSRASRDETRAHWASSTPSGSRPTSVARSIVPALPSFNNRTQEVHQDSTDRITTTGIDTNANATVGTTTEHTL